MRGIVLAGGLGTRLRPLTWVMSKQLLPIYDKPMIYYPLATLMQAGIREVLFISTAEDLPRIEQLLGDGSRWGMQLSYAVQHNPKGIADAFIIGEDFIQNEGVTLILGDNLFYDKSLEVSLSLATNKEQGATIFGYRVEDPSRFGVFDLDSRGNIVDIIEKPIHPPSNYAVTGLYCYDKSVVEKAKSLSLSGRGELEITDINKLYLQEGSLDVSFLDSKEAFWMDAGTVNSLYKASHFVEKQEKLLGHKLGCIEEIAFLKNYISLSQLEAIALSYGNNEYGKYLLYRIEQMV
ncbi:glucose-1-phosphate thymidylyltransferase [Candidatus Aerophobetes bacterium]|uniref:Glucose-1-phosphate thymidylyltransferase n=1 Tax=Aerophobetes bacterium TaxID=2030807 RepID=A0A2A4X3S3_UNCAE|nr:MAG: glucose-1-phosphate thymidylyltransferase [Candidatus Aerophobetes bacterium]